MWGPSVLSVQTQVLFLVTLHVPKGEEPGCARGKGALQENPERTTHLTTGGTSQRSPLLPTQKDQVCATVYPRGAPPFLSQGSRNQEAKAEV